MNEQTKKNTENINPISTSTAANYENKHDLSVFIVVVECFAIALIECKFINSISMLLLCIFGRTYEQLCKTAFIKLFL